MSTRRETKNGARRQRAAYGVSVFATVFIASAASASDSALVLLPDFETLPFLLVLFIALMFPANALLFKPIFRVLDAREERTNGTRRRAEKILRDADETLRNYEQAVREVRVDAELDRKAAVAVARKENAAVTAAAREGVQVEAERAGRELAAALEESRVTMREQAENIANEAAASVLGRPL